MYRKLVLFVLVTAASVRAASPKLPRSYADWLNGPVSYLLTKTERQTFLTLKTDEERDRFVERFWELRNPIAGTARNEFRDEFYTRLAHVNAFFGNDGGSDGWRTDRGRTYLVFGKPQAVTSFVYNQELYPTELWFYANPGLSELPPFFYVLFYDKDGIGGYRFYQPAVDGPDKIMRAGPSRAQAYTYLKNINAELARATLTFIPGEPVDTEATSGSMGSQVIIQAAHGYSQMPSYTALISQRAVRLERVTSRVQYDLGRAEVLTFVAWQNGEAWLHWQLEVQDPKQPKAVSGFMQFEVHAQLFSGGHLVFERTDAPKIGVPAGGEEELKKRPFVYEDRMAVVPGKYRLLVTARNLPANVSYEAVRDFEVARPADRVILSDLVLVSRFEPDSRERPFQFGGIKFFPDAARATVPMRGLRVCYQVLLTNPRPAELAVEYVIGNPVTRARKSFDDKLDLSAVDSFGSLVTGKTLSTDGLSPGSYQLAVRVKDTQTGIITARSIPFTISDEASDVRPIIVSQGPAGTPQKLASNQYERALCWLAQGRSQEALAALEASWKINPNRAVQGLIEYLQARAGRSSR